MFPATLRRGSLWLPLIVSALCACAPSARMSSDLNRLQRELADLRSFQAEQTTQISGMQAEMRSFNGRLEELEFSQNRRMGSDLTQLRDDVSRLRRRVPPPAVVPVEALEADEALAATLAAEISGRFNDALGLLREGRFAEALTILQEVQDMSSNNDAYANIIFWIGIAHEGLSNNREALKAFHAITTNYPRHPRCALALLRVAGVFSRLGDSTSMRLTYQKLIVDFPKSPEAGVAKDRLKQPVASTGKKTPR